MNDRRFLRTVDAAAYLGVSPRTLEALRLRGGGPRFLRPDGRRLVLYDARDLEAWAINGPNALHEEDAGFRSP